MFNQKPCPLLYNPQKTIFNPISEIKNHTIQHSNQTDPPHAKAFISPTLDTKNPESLRMSTYYSVDVIYHQSSSINSVETLKFIENFSKHVYFKTTLSDNQRMERLLNVLDGEAKRMVQSIGQSDIFYPTVLKCLKRDYGKPTVISYLKLKELFDQPQLQAKISQQLEVFSSS